MNVAKLREIFDEYDNREPKFLDNKEAATVMAWLRPMLNASQDTEELRKAAERCLNGGDDNWSVSGDYYMSSQHEVDTELVSKWVLAEITRRDAEQAERELPIDEEWLRSIGFCSGAMGFLFLGAVFVDPSLRYLPVYVGGLRQSSALDKIKNRGQLLDLLSAMKGGAT